MCRTFFFGTQNNKVWNMKIHSNKMVHCSFVPYLCSLYCTFFNKKNTNEWIIIIMTKSENYVINIRSMTRGQNNDSHDDLASQLSNHLNFLYHNYILWHNYDLSKQVFFPIWQKFAYIRHLCLSFSVEHIKRQFVYKMKVSGV